MRTPCTRRPDGSTAKGGLYALNDAGLVMSQSGTYVLAVLTNACGRNDLLTSLIGTLDAVHSGDMRG